ncbi:hypothetical protein [Nocardia transvalensis]|uniref:hypothetical protein n=1 Tax=Nocardia transvalensis TaxID=37333 RepID=UPI0018936EAA|nr:hypothetical protein [Nocardia transvalensis]MBF6333589.1 hypothetical protein [Nocardia transvalensis]
MNADTIATIGMLVLLFLLFGGGGVVVEILGNQKKRAALKRELGAAKKEIARLTEQLDKAASITPGGPHVAGMIEQARLAIDERAVLIDALNQVQATDNVVPQLPREVRDLVDQALSAHRAKLMLPSANSKTTNKS